MRIADLFRLTGLNLCNGHLDISHNLGLIFAHCLMIENVQTLYHPRFNLYTKIRENRMNYDRVTIDEHWAFYTSLVITTKYIVRERWHKPIRKLCRRYPFIRRLFHQLMDEGSFFAKSLADNDGRLIIDLIEDR